MNHPLQVTIILTIYQVTIHLILRKLFCIVTKFHFYSMCPVIELEKKNWILIFTNLECVLFLREYDMSRQVYKCICFEHITFEWMINNLR